MSADDPVMERRSLGGTGRTVSAVALGGHEYLEDGRLKGFGDDLANAVRPGYVRADLGGRERTAIVARAVERGVTFFDVTMDPEVSALGVALSTMPAAADFVVQVRPQGMCYRYEPGNAALVEPGRLRSEATRLRDLLRRDRVDLLNLGIESEALDRDPDFLRRLGDVVADLRSDGLVRHLACDSLFSGEAQYVRLLDSGCFDVVWLSFGPLAPTPADVVLPRARAAGLGVVAREAFAKGALFRVAAEAGVDVPTARLAAAAERWVLAQAEVSALAVGVRTVRELDANLDAAAGAVGDDDELLERVLATPAARAVLDENVRAFRTT